MPTFPVLQSWVDPGRYAKREVLGSVVVADADAVATAPAAAATAAAAPVAPVCALAKLAKHIFASR
eukprot:1148553-Pelagomonas_calceolata.AAC.2